MENAQFSVANTAPLAKVLRWAAQFPYACALVNASPSHDRYGRYRWLVGVRQSAPPAIADLHAMATVPGWWLGGLGYGLKAGLYPQCPNTRPLMVAFPPVAMFPPEVLLALPLGGNDVRVWAANPAAVWAAVQREQPGRVWATKKLGPWTSNFSEAGYMAAVEQVRAFIREGETYELNLSQEFTAEGTLPEPIVTFERLLAAQPVPQAGLLKWQNTWLLGGSPERLLQHQAGRLRTQPIKGTAQRLTDPAQDQATARRLQESPKERAENVMIVDLARNDLNRSCVPGSVVAESLFELQAYRTVHQMVSTVVGHRRPEVPPLQALAHVFPAGSMTGAPKLRTMQLIEALEPTARGLYAGSLGYIAPGGDFDFNVIIRSLALDTTQKTLSYHVGGAVTYGSDPAAEYAETLLKATALRAVLQ